MIPAFCSHHYILPDVLRTLCRLHRPYRVLYLFPLLNDHCTKKPRSPDSWSLRSLSVPHRGLPDTISERSGHIGYRIGNAGALLIFDDIVLANLKPYRYDIGNEQYT